MSFRMMRLAVHICLFTPVALGLPTLARHTSAPNLTITNVSNTAAWKLNPPLPAGGQVKSSVISPDGSQVVYVANQETASLYEVFRVPVVGGTSAKLNGTLVAGISAGSATISPDGSRVIYTARQVGDQTEQLYSVPLAGGTATRLNSPLGSTTFVSQALFSPDSSHVVYVTVQNSGQTQLREIYSVPLAGGAAVKLNSDLVGEQRVEAFQISPDSTQVVYELNQGQQSSAPRSLYHVPLTGGAPVKLDDPFTSNAAHSFVISPDSSRVVYSRQPQPSDPIELYAAPLNGQPPVKIDSPAGINVDPYSIVVSADSGHVVYSTGYPSGGPYELYSTALTPGGTAVKLNRPLEANANVAAFKVSPDSSRVVYVANHGPYTQNEIYSVPIGGGASATLNGTLDPNGKAVQLEIYISPDSQRVVYLADQQADDSSSGIQIYSAPIGGGTPAVKISGPVIPFGFIVTGDILFTPDSQNVLYRAEGTTSNLYDLFVTAADGSVAASKLNTPAPPMVAGYPSEVAGQREFQVSANSRYVVFRGARGRDALRELYAVELISLRNNVFLPFIQR
jgi:Tol biopolymer transport system component